MTGLLWILPTSGWWAERRLQSPHYLPYLRGSLGVANCRGELPGFKDFVLKTRPDNGHEDDIVSILFNLNADLIVCL